MVQWSHLNQNRLGGFTHFKHYILSYICQSSSSNSYQNIFLQQVLSLRFYNYNLFTSHHPTRVHFQHFCSTHSRHRFFCFLKWNHHIQIFSLNGPDLFKGVLLIRWNKLQDSSNQVKKSVSSQEMTWDETKWSLLNEADCLLQLKHRSITNICFYNAKTHLHCWMNRKKRGERHSKAHCFYLSTFPEQQHMK